MVLNWPLDFRCMDIHAKKLEEIKKTHHKVSLKEGKRVEDQLNRKHQDKLRTFEFMRQGKLSNLLIKT